MKTLVLYFSAEGTTAAAAKQLAAIKQADLFEIRPAETDSAADLRYTNPLARCNREFFGKKDVPAVGRIENFSSYDTVMLGFPIWYGGAPNVVSTFCKAYDWTGKTVYIFATSGGSAIGKTAKRLSTFLHGAVIKDARVIHQATEMDDWM